MHGPSHGINSCKFIQVQAKPMKATWSYAHEGGGSGKFTSTDKHEHSNHLCCGRGPII